MLFFKEEARILEQEEKANIVEIFLDQILGEGPYSDPKHSSFKDLGQDSGTRKETWIISQD